MTKLNNGEQSQSKIWKVISIFPIGIAIFQILLILNWLFQITPFQKLEGLPLLLTPFISTVGIIFAIIALQKDYNRIIKLGIITNCILFFLPWIYWYVGTLIFGP
ncbi:hypothetical protein [Clostridium ganghwense]|uniref:Uncharacterized protein n=1 Tax=Clostridium ganghwense TaxID=312089 RepID=A0ABT4CWD8_9CLOT|nr:hypothetical protein [Clostridium ganghwense]MCY6372209.1 hypothetical protein [Clostridium ganghwense]